MCGWNSTLSFATWLLIKASSNHQSLYCCLLSIPLWTVEWCLFLEMHTLFLVFYPCLIFCSLTLVNISSVYIELYCISLWYRSYVPILLELENRLHQHWHKVSEKPTFSSSLQSKIYRYLLFLNIYRCFSELNYQLNLLRRQSCT